MGHFFLEHFPKTTELLNSAVGDVFHAYSVGVFFNEKKSFLHHGCGPESFFDLASLTKVLCTTSLFALAETKGVLQIDNPVSDFFPKVKDKRIKISHLLNHSSGLPAWLALHDKFHDLKVNPFSNAKQVRAYFEEEILSSFSPDDFEKSSVYSDLGFMLLGWILEKSTLYSLDLLFQSWIAKPLELSHLQFLPISPDVVPTEECLWRGHVLRGEVHDDNCYVLGGVAGHAGLFGNAENVLRLAQLWLNSLTAEENQPTWFLPRDLAQKYWNFSHVKNTTRPLGWDAVSIENSSAGRFFSRSTRGHLGFTGTSLWIDPERNLIVTLLTNRVHPTRKNEKIKSFRPLFHDTLLRELGIGS